MKRTYLPCECYDHAHYVYLCFDTWPDEDDFGSLADPPDLFVSTVVHPLSWLDRLRVAWRILRGREHDFGEVMLSPDHADRLRDAVHEYQTAVLRWQDARGGSQPPSDQSNAE